MSAAPLDAIVGAHLPAAARGDRDAYSRIVGACQNSITAIALAMVRDVPASEDIAQEAFLSGWQNIGKLHNPASFLPWLRQITRNLAHDHLRQRRRQPPGVDDMDAAIAAAADPAPGAVERLIQAERTQVAAELISALPAESREVLLLYYREGQSSQQVAALLGLSDAAVRKRLSRARNTVREELLDRFAVFARASAPSVGFTTLVASALGVIAPTGPATVALAAGSAGSGLAGKFGSAGLGASGGVLGGAVGFLVERVLSPISVAVGGAPLDAAPVLARLDSIPLPPLAGIAAGTASGALATLLIARYLQTFAATAAERRRIDRLVFAVIALNTAMSLACIATFELSRGWLWPVVAALACIAVSMWQWTVQVPRALAPSLQRMLREGRPDPRQGWIYRWMLGPRPMIWSSLLLLAMMLAMLYRDGRLG